MIWGALIPMFPCLCILFQFTLPLSLPFFEHLLSFWTHRPFLLFVTLGGRTSITQTILPISDTVSRMYLLNHTHVNKFTYRNFLCVGCRQPLLWLLLILKIEEYYPLRKRNFSCCFHVRQTIYQVNGTLFLQTELFIN